MSRQLAIAVSGSVFAMAAFALFATPGQPGGVAGGSHTTGAETYVAAPALDWRMPALSDLIG